MTHNFAKKYTGLVGYGLDRPTDEATLKVYLQKFSADDCLETIIPRLDQADMDRLFDLICSLVGRKLDHHEYHNIFLKESNP